MKIAKARTDEEKKEIYEKWEKLINMSEKELLSWAENDDRFLASLNRERAEEEGDIQSGYDSFHRIKRRKIKPMKDWSAKDFDNASQENGFNSRMLGGKPGQPVGDTGMSKWEISLRNWGHDPSKKSSPSYDKWKAWDNKHNKTARYASFRTDFHRANEIVSELLKRPEKYRDTLIKILEKYFSKDSKSTEVWARRVMGVSSDSVSPKDLAIEIVDFWLKATKPTMHFKLLLVDLIRNDRELYFNLSHYFFGVKHQRTASLVKKYLMLKSRGLSVKQASFRPNLDSVYKIVAELLKRHKKYRDEIIGILEGAFSRDSKLHDIWSRHTMPHGDITNYSISESDLAKHIVDSWMDEYGNLKSTPLRIVMASEIQEDVELYFELSRYFFGVKHQRTASNRFFIRRALMLKERR